MSRQVNQSTGPLGRGWHRVTWTDCNRRQYVVSDDITSATLVVVALKAHGVGDAVMESWSEYPLVDGAYAPEEDAPQTSG